MPKRILTSQIDSTYADGQILYGSDINRIIDVFKTGINENASDLYKLLVGISTTYIASNKVGLDNYLSEYQPAHGQLGFVMNGDDADATLEMYEYNLAANIWVFKDTISILQNYQDIQKIVATTTRTGFPLDCSDNFNIQFNDATRTFTITALVETIVFIQGEQFTLPVGWSKSIVITNEEGAHFITLHPDGELRDSYQVPWDLRTKPEAPVVEIYWDEENKQRISMAYELHSYELSGVDHFQKHFTDATYLINGLQLVVNGYDVSITNGSIGDEDILVNIKHSENPTKYFEQELTPRIKSYKYFRNQNGYIRKTQNDTKPFYVAGYKVQLNPFNETTNEWELVGLGVGKWGAYWVVLTTDIDNPVKYFLGQNEADNINNAKEVNSYEAMNFGAIPTEEILVAYRIMVQGSGASPFYTIGEVDTYLSDPKTGNSVNLGSGTGDHSGLINLLSDDHPQYYNDTRLWLTTAAGKIRYNNNLYFSDLGEASLQDVIDNIGARMAIVEGRVETFISNTDPADTEVVKLNDIWFEI